MYGTNTNNNLNAKRQNFRQQIRRRQVEQIFAQNRKNYAISQQQASEYEPANSNLMKLCLIKNQLISQLPTLLPSLAHKIRNNKNVANIEFVITVSTNILLDSITIDQKQYIYGYCLTALKDVQFCSISPLVQVYFCMTVMNVCYGCFQQARQIQIEEIMLPRIMQMLDVYHLDVTRAPTQYTEYQVRSTVLEDALSALNYFYEIDQDHNNTLLYKVKRTVNSLIYFINWAGKYISQISKFPNFPQLLSLTNTILTNISAIPYPLSSLIPAKSLSTLVQILIGQIQYQDEELDEIKCIAINTFINLYKQQSELISQSITKQKLYLLVGQLEKSIKISYQISLIKLFSDIVVNFLDEKQHMQENILDDVLNSVVSAVLSIIRDREEDTDEILLKQALILLKVVAGLGYEWGNGNYVNFMRGAGMEQLLDGLYIKVKNQDLIDEIDQIYRFIDIC